jgi:hypothetical protein
MKDRSTQRFLGHGNVRHNNRWSWQITCCRCGAESKTVQAKLTPDSTMTKFKRAGWHVSRSGNDDLCQQCRAPVLEEQDRKRQAEIDNGKIERLLVLIRDLERYIAENITTSGGAERETLNACFVSLIETAYVCDVYVAPAPEPRDSNAVHIVIEPGLTPLQPQQLLSEEEYQDARRRYQEAFTVESGVKAVMWHLGIPLTEARAMAIKQSDLLATYKQLVERKELEFQELANAAAPSRPPPAAPEPEPEPEFQVLENANEPLRAGLAAIRIPDEREALKAVRALTKSVENVPLDEIFIALIHAPPHAPEPKAAAPEPPADPAAPTNSAADPYANQNTVDFLSRLRKQINA